MKTKLTHPKTATGFTKPFPSFFLFAEVAEGQTRVCVYLITAKMEGPVRAAATLSV